MNEYVEFWNEEEVSSWSRASVFDEFSEEFYAELERDTSREDNETIDQINENSGYGRGE